MSGKLPIVQSKSIGLFSRWPTGSYFFAADRSSPSQPQPSSVSRSTDGAQDLHGSQLAPLSAGRRPVPEDHGPLGAWDGERWVRKARGEARGR